jgi:hypothetical protein
VGQVVAHGHFIENLLHVNFPPALPKEIKKANLSAFFIPKIQKIRQQSSNRLV